MRRKFLFAVLLTIQCLWAATQVFAMDEFASGISSKSVKYAQSREQRLSGFFSQIFGLDVQVTGNTVNFKGNQRQLAEAANRLNDFNQLRKHVIPVSSKVTTTQSCSNAKFTSWSECLTAIGIQQSDLSDFSLSSYLDQESCLKIPYGSESGPLTFYQKVAKMYVEEVKNRSAYFDWVSRTNPELVQTIDEYLTINYGLLTDYLCSLPIQMEPTDNDNIFVSQLSVQSVLKKLTAAAGGDISLVETSTPGRYQVRTVMLGSDNYNRGSTVPTIEIVIDKSTSMGGDKIDAVNNGIPVFLKKLRSALTEGQTLKVDIFVFSDDIAPYSTYTLSHSNSSEILWKNISINGGTDLTKVAQRLSLSSPDERKVVVAFTDGEHESNSDLDGSLSSLSMLQHEGSFAQPYFCRVGVASDKNTSYFSKISNTFAGSFYDHDSVEDFCTKVSSNIPYLLESNTPLILTLNGVDVTIRQQDAKPDVHVTNQTVGNEDAIMHRGIRGIVDVTSEIQRLEAQIAALKTTKK